MTAGERATPETYLGAARAEGFTTPPVVGTRKYELGDVGSSKFSLGGTWTVDDESATAGRDAVLRARVLGKDVYLVLSGPGTVRVTVDGSFEKTVRVTSQDIYTLLSRPATGEHEIELRFSARRLRLRVHVRVIRRV